MVSSNTSCDTNTMTYYQELKTAIFIFINLFSLLNYAILGAKISNIGENTSIGTIFSIKVINVFYICLIIFIGVRFFAFFIGRDLNDLLLHRSLNSGGTRIKLRVLAILILIEMLVFGTYFIYILYLFNILHDNTARCILILICTSHILNIFNLYMINYIHPDLCGFKYKNRVNNYFNRLERERQAISSV